MPINRIIQIVVAYIKNLTKSLQRLEFPVPKLDINSFYGQKLFHGIKTEAEAYNICKAEMRQSGKPQAF